MSSSSSQSVTAPEQPGKALLRTVARRIAWHPWRLVLPALLFGLAFGAHLYQERLAGDDLRFLGQLEDQVRLSLQVARGIERVQKDPDAPLTGLREQHSRARASLETLYPPRTPLKLWAAPQAIEARLADIDAQWIRSTVELDVLAARRVARERLDQSLIRFQATATRMLITSDELVVAMVAAEEPPEQVRVAARQLVLIQRMLTNAQRLLAGGNERLTAADRFGRDAVLLGSVNNGLLSGNAELAIAGVKDEAVRELLYQMGRQFREAEEQVQAVVNQSVELARLEGAVADATRLSEAIVAATRDLQSAYRAYLDTRPLKPEHTRLLGGLALASLLLAALLMAMDTRVYRRAEQQRLGEEQLRREQLEQAAGAAPGSTDLQQVSEELLRLMADLGRVVEVETVPRPGEDPGEAVTRGLGRVLAELHSRVDAIVTSAHQVATSATTLREATSKLNAQRRQQTQNVDKAAGVTQELAAAVKLGYTHVSKLDSLTESAASEARAVQERVGGAMRDLEGLGTSVQETSRRVRRLMESAHEARTVALHIEELSDHSKMLSLNVAIQSTTQASATRSSASFADELQRLAERAREVVQSVERLRESLRSDAEEAVKAIKHTAWSLKGTGEQLHKAERPIANLNLVSRKLEKFAQSLVGSGQEHTLRATEVVRAVTAVHTVAAQSGVGAEAAATSAAHLAELVVALQAHVSRLHPVPTQDGDVVALDSDRSVERDAKKRDEPRKARAGLRPVS